MRLAHLLADEGLTAELWLGALIDAGAPVEALQQAIDAAGIAAKLEVDLVRARDVRAVRVEVVTDPSAPRVDRPEALHATVDAGGLSARAAGRAHQVVDALCRAEAAVHDIPVAEVRLHELGRPRAIARIIAGAAALEALDVGHVTVGPIAVGGGTVEIAHGRFPVPPPAVLALLEGFTIEGGDRAEECTTPSGAAVLAALAESVAATPRMHLEAHGRGTIGEGDLLRIATVLLGSRVGDLDETGGAGRTP